MQSAMLVDSAGRRRSPATLPGHHKGRAPRNKGMRYPADPPTVEEIICVMRAAGEDTDGVRLRGLIVVLWRAGLRISEALALSESDLDPARGAILVRHGKGDKRREIGMDRWAWEQLTPWLTLRATLPVGALFCVLRGPTRGRPWAAAGVRAQLHQTAARAGCDAGLLPTSCVTPTQSRCHAKAFRCWSSSASSVTPTWRSPRSTCAASTTPRSSKLSTNVPHRPSPPTTACTSGPSNGYAPN